MPRTRFPASLLVIVVSIAFVATLTAQDVKDTSDAELVSVPKPPLPAEAKKAGVGGNVMVRVVVARNGSVFSVEDVRGPDWVCPAVSTLAVVALRNAARQAAMKAKFKPSMKNGEAVQATTFLNFAFKSLSGLSMVTFGAKALEQDLTKPTDILDPNAPVSDRPKTLSGGVLNGKAAQLSKPGYPAAARAVAASGSVVVQVIINLDGTMYSAQALTGHPFLRAAAREAACSSSFEPTLLNGQPVRVSGVITYNFVP